jgi:DNA-binding MarR family transcriptional regulator
MTQSEDLAPAVRTLARVARSLERASGSLSLADFRVLSEITGGEVQASRLAELLALGKPAISASVDSLTRRGLLTREPVPGDNRATKLVLTAEGATRLAATEAHLVERFDGLLEHTADPAAVLAAFADLAQAVELERAERAAARRAARS